MEQPSPQERYSWNDYLSWPPDERYELIDGTAYAVAAPRRRHQEIVGEIFRQAATTLKGRPCRVFIAPFDVKLSGDDADDSPTVLQPDIVVTCDTSKLTRQGMSGAPDLVVEVVSSDSGLADRRRKFEVYRRYGVGEYWIVDGDEVVAEVYLLESDGTYRRAAVLGPEDRLKATVTELAIDLAEVFAD